MGRPRFDPRARQQQGPRVNHRIRVPQVRVVGADGEMLGVLDTPEAQRLARDAGLDLVEVNPKAYPPVCKIMDFGKFKYDEKKRSREAKKRQTQVELKEIKLRPKTDDHDLDFKLKHVRRFLEEGNKVKITCRFRGREITHPETAQAQLDFIRDNTQDIGQVEVTPRMEGRTMTLILAPQTKVVQRTKRPAQSSQPDQPQDNDQETAPAP
ncbi:MAG: translation initiation factor IF-3 [Myxococcales bacterium]|nr:translation initiation factor IF-3 [Myxococcales bacterium]